MNKVLVNLLFILNTGLVLVFAGQSFVIAQEPGKLLYLPTEYNKVIVQKDIEYRSFADKSLKFDFYRLADNGNADQLPVVIFMNGIGSADLKNSAIQTEWAKTCAATGFAAVTFQSHFEGQSNSSDLLLQSISQDFDELIQYLRSNRKKFGINTDTVIIHASSGNVSLGWPILLDKKRSFIKAAVIYYGSAEVPVFRLDLPVFFVRAGLDQPSLNRKIDTFLGRALASNAPFEIVNHPGGQHPFEMGDKNQVSSEIIARTLEFMRRAISAPVQDSIYATMDEAAAGAALLTENWSEAVSGYALLVDKRPQDNEMHRRYADALAGAKEYEKALEEYEKALVLGSWRKRDIAYAASVAGAKLGDVKSTLKWLNRLVNTPFDRSKLLTDPNFAFLRDNPEFRALAEYKSK